MKAVSTWHVAVIGTAIILSAAGASAQTLNVHLSSPGARAGAMGRAFIGVANDASTSITNPGGLVTLTKPQAYVEFRSTSQTAVLDPTDTFHLNSISFASVSGPVNDRVAVGFTIDEFEHVKDPAVGEERGVSYAGSIAARVNDKFDVGVTISADHTTGDFPDDNGTPIGIIVGGLYRANEYVSVGFVAGRSYGGLNRVGGGAGLRPTPRLLAAFDVVRYSDGDLGVSFVEVHGGGEFLLVTGPTRVFLRAGAFHSSGDLTQVISQNAGTFGLGVAVGRTFQVDFAYETTKELLLSAGVRFK